MNNEKNLTEREAKQYGKAFNAGYLLSQHEPKLLAKILKSPSEDHFYIEGIKAGKKHYEREKFKE